MLLDIFQMPLLSCCLLFTLFYAMPADAAAAVDDADAAMPPLSLRFRRCHTLISAAAYFAMLLMLTCC